MESTEAARVEGSDHFERAAVLAERFLDNIEWVVYGKREEVKLVLSALVCGGHVLFEDVPGTAKTVLARAIAQSIDGATPSRIQCTPDLQPTDVTGLSIFNQKERDFEFRAGPIFANVVLVDEINRAMPKTQSALARGDGRAAGHGRRRDARSCPIRSCSSRPRTRSSTRGRSRCPRRSSTASSSRPRSDIRTPRTSGGSSPSSARSSPPAARARDQRGGRAGAEGGRAGRVRRRADPAVDRRPRPRRRASHEWVAIGASVRGSLALERAARGWALLGERSYVVPDDVERLFVPVLMHRIVFRPAFLAEARRDGWADAAAQLPRAASRWRRRPVADPDGEVFSLGARRA